MLHWIAVKGVKLITTNFHADFTLASPPSLKESAKNSMELVFMLTGWDFPLSGKKAAELDVICKALVVQFDFSLPRDLVLKVSNTEARRNEVISMISGAIGNGRLEKPCLLDFGGQAGLRR